MAVPLIIAGAGALLFGAKKHYDAHETNDLADYVIKKSQNKYENQKKALEQAQNSSGKALLDLGNLKIQTLEGSMKNFLSAYDRIKHILLSNSDGLDELSNIKFEQQDAVQLQEMSSSIGSTLASGAAGAVTGMALGLATSGLAGITIGGVGAIAGMGGTLLAMGDIAGAISMFAGGVSLGVTTAVAATPLAVLAAPVVVFSGLSANRKAEENYEKAHAFEAEVDAACEKMETSITLCKAISKRAKMFSNLLKKLDTMFSACAIQLDNLTAERLASLNGSPISREDFSADEMKLIAVSRALAGSVKAILDTPILSPEGDLATGFQNIYNSGSKQLPVFSQTVSEIGITTSHDDVINGEVLAKSAESVCEPDQQV